MSWRMLVCGRITIIVGWYSARTTGFTFDRISSLDTEFPLARRTPSALAPTSMVPSRSGAMTAARSIFIKPQKCGDSNKSFLILSHPIHCFDEIETMATPSAEGGQVDAIPTKWPAVFRRDIPQY
jgi:hypothetical protein